MAYVALLRGINVGGKALVGMAELRRVFEELGLSGVRTYINSGNVIFTGGDRDRARLRRRIERALADRVGLETTVVLRDTAELAAVVDALPASWRNDDRHRCDVFFSDDFVRPDGVGLLPLTPGVEEVRFVPGAILCRGDRSDLRRSRLTRLVGTDLYRRMTARNCNTARKLYELLVAADGSDGSG